MSLKGAVRHLHVVALGAAFVLRAALPKSGVSSAPRLLFRPRRPAKKAGEVRIFGIAESRIEGSGFRALGFGVRQ